jgi:hypothetical protein
MVDTLSPQFPIETKRQILDLFELEELMTLFFQTNEEEWLDDFPDFLREINRKNLVETYRVTPTGQVFLRASERESDDPHLLDDGKGEIVLLQLYREMLDTIFRRWESSLGPKADFTIESVVDPKTDRYLLVQVGWNGYRRVYHTMVHVDIIDGKLWVQKDDTERGVAEELVEAGVPRDRIVLGFKHESHRPYTDFAPA